MLADRAASVKEEGWRYLIGSVEGLGLLLLLMIDRIVLVH
jgi:hypothetical protein